MWWNCEGWCWLALFVSVSNKKQMGNEPDKIVMTSWGISVVDMIWITGNFNWGCVGHNGDRLIPRPRKSQAFESNRPKSSFRLLRPSFSAWRRRAFGCRAPRTDSSWRPSAWRREIPSRRRRGNPPAPRPHRRRVASRCRADRELDRELWCCWDYPARGGWPSRGPPWRPECPRSIAALEHGCCNLRGREAHQRFISKFMWGREALTRWSGRFFASSIQGWFPGNYLWQKIDADLLWVLINL